MATEQKLPRLSKRMKTVRAKVDHGKAYAIDDALKLVKETAVAKFDESVDVAVNLGVDAKKSDQTVRGSVVLPAGTGKKVRIAVFAQGDKAKVAQDAGADIVGFDDLAAKDQGRLHGVRRRHRDAGCDEGRRPARPDPRPARIDAEPEGRHCHGGRASPPSRTRARARSSTAPTRQASSSARSAGRRSRPSSSRPTCSRWSTR